MKNHESKFLKHYFWDKKVNQLISEELIEGDSINSVECFTRIKNILIPLEYHQSQYTKDLEGTDHPMVDAYLVVVKIDY